MPLYGCAFNPHKPQKDQSEARARICSAWKVLAALFETWSALLIVPSFVSPGQISLASNCPPIGYPCLYPQSILPCPLLPGAP